jgi:hypothetical protein
LSVELEKAEDIAVVFVERPNSLEELELVGLPCEGSLSHPDTHPTDKCDVDVGAIKRFKLGLRC